MDNQRFVLHKITDNFLFRFFFQKVAKFPEIAAKLAELMPKGPDDVRAVLGSRRITIDAGEIEEILDIVRKHV